MSSASTRSVLPITSTPPRTRIAYAAAHVVASKARRVTDGMILAAARALGEQSPARKDPSGSLLPALRDVRTVIVRSVGERWREVDLARALAGGVGHG